MSMEEIHKELRQLPLSARVGWANKHLPPIQTEYRIAYEDPTDEDGVKVVTPDPHWMSAAMFGGILPPNWVYEELASDEAKEGFVKHTRGHLLNDTDPMPPMSEEEAIEHLIERVIPRHVWMANSPKMKIMRADQLPSRKFRSAWRLAA